MTCPNLRNVLNQSSRVFVVLVAAAVAGPSVNADMLTIDAMDAGFVTEMGGSSKGDGTIFAPATYNYSVGQELHYSDGSLGIPPGTTPLAYMDRNNYFVFDLSSITDTVIGATLLLPAGTFESVDPFETFHIVAPVDPGAALFDADSLLAGNAIGPSEFDEPSDPLVSVAAAMYGNIESGGGFILGTSIISSADDDTILGITLDPAGIDYINSFLGGMLIFGGDVSTITPGDTVQQPFGGTGPIFPKLELTTIPEPSGMWLSGIAIGVVMLRRRRR